MSKNVRRLLESFQPEHYQLELRPNRETMHFTGTVTIKGKKTGRPSQRLTFHQNGLKITSAQVIKHDKKQGDQAIEITRINNQNTLHEVRLHSDKLLYGGAYTITLEFEAPITRGMTGLYPAFFTLDGQEHTLLATQFESHHAREVFPCIDEPAAKATFDLALVHDSQLTALGNTPIRSQIVEEELTTTLFETSPKMSTYLLAFVLGEIHSISGKTKSGVDVNIWGTLAQPKDSFTFALDAAIRSIEFFEDYFGVPYPLPKADHVALPDFSSGAMENWGLITYREAVLLSYPEAQSQSTNETIALVVAHETSHQWFGNLVTMKWWDDLWLNESFANMMEYQAVDSMFPAWNIWNTFIASEGLSALRRDAVPGVQAVRTSVHHPDEISSLFDPSIVYAKGGRLLYMLKNYIGEDAFRAGLSAYFKKHAYGNTTGADLWTALSAASNQDIGAFMNPWLERSGFPVVSVTQSGGDVTLSQQHFLDSMEKADPDRIWPIPLFSEKPGDLLAKAGDERQTATDLYRINQGAKGHYIVCYTEDTQNQQLAGLVKDGKLPVPDRLMLLSDSAMLARAGLSSFNKTLELLRAYAAEDSEAVWDIMALVIADARRFIDVDESLEAPIKQLVAGLVQAEYERLGWEEKPDESSEDQKLRGTILGLGAYAEVPAIVSHAQDLFSQYKTDTSVVSAELRGIVFGVAVKTQHDSALDYLIDLYKSTGSSDLQRDISGALTATRQPAEAEQLLALAKDAKVVKPQDADRWVFMLLRNRYVKKLAWQWMEDNWSWIEETYKQDKSYDYFPRIAASVVSTKAEAEKYEAFFGPKESVPILARNIAIGREEITARLAWLARDIDKVQTFFKAQ